MRFSRQGAAVAVNENGRATALGYQRFTLQKNAADLEIPFGARQINRAAGPMKDVVSVQYPDSGDFSLGEGI